MYLFLITLPMLIYKAHSHINSELDIIAQTGQGLGFPASNPATTEFFM